ncbi:MAG: UDP-N-acetylglucosamine diphosphorylase/glucosamine-1-phosphate N-acetyltransferase, partial [Deltaproteobacteria bacterium]|nr:UDP-N-acetylglucosamine diphosphorylase/glucosamine-1-phosphate N-acetyltransferase [Deltaproteobacteria bacterium]
AEKVQAALQDYPVRFVVQEPQLGTGHAVQEAMPEVPNDAQTIMVLCGDVPLISQESIINLYQLHQQFQAAVTVQTVILPDGAHYGRVVRDEQGRVVEVAQSKDSKDRPDILAIKEINTGAYCFDAAFLKEGLAHIPPSPVTGEIYLTDMIHIARRQGRGVEALIDPDWEHLLGINSRAELAQATSAVKRRINEGHMDNGVTLMDPESTYIESLVTIGKDTVIYPNVYLQGRTVIGEGCLIEPNVKISDSHLAPGVVVKMGSVISESRLAPKVQVGPYSHLRPLSDLREGARVGNFVEVKKSVLHHGVKANHLTYLGDAEVGPNVNVGAGTITCNYDGVHKHPTIIEEGAFIGSNTALVAPVTIGRGAYVGAGSTITEDVPPGKLGISRARQVNLERRLTGPNKAALPDSDALTPEKLSRLLTDLGLICAKEDVEELVQIFGKNRVRTVGDFRKIATVQNLEMVKNMYLATEGQDPSNYEMAANLASLAGALNK